MNTKRSRNVKSSVDDNGFRPMQWVLIAAGLVVGIGLVAYALVGTSKESSQRLAEGALPPAAVVSGPSPASSDLVTPGVVPQQVDTDSVEATPLLPLATVPQADDHDHGVELNVQRTDAAELQEAVNRGEVVVIDVRDNDSYESGHIPGALHIPLAMLESQTSYLPRGKPIVAYCT